LIYPGKLEKTKVCFAPLSREILATLKGESSCTYSVISINIDTGNDFTCSLTKAFTVVKASSNPFCIFKYSVSPEKQTPYVYSSGFCGIDLKETGI